MTTENELTIEIVGFAAICPKCGESDIRNLEILVGRNTRGVKLITYQGV